MQSQRAAQTAIMVLSNAIAVCVAVTANDEATRIHLRPDSLSISRLGRCRRTCQASGVFVFRGESFDFLQEHSFRGGEQGDGGRELLEHRLFVGGSVGQVVEIALFFFILDGFSR